MLRAHRHQDLLFLVAAALVLALFLRLRSVGNDAHVAVVSAFEELQARESRRDHELLALRYGLSMNYDGLRSIETEIAKQRQVVQLAPGSVEAVPGSALVQALAEVDAGLEDKARRVEDFVSDSAMLNNALRGLPKATALVLESVDASGEQQLAADLQLLVSSVFRYGLTGEEAIQANARALLGPLGDASSRLNPIQKSRLETALFLARTILDGQAQVDRELRGILALDGATRIDRALKSYLDAHGRIEGRIRATR